MTLETARDRRSPVRVRTARVDELPDGTPDEQRAAVLASVRRLPNGRAASREDMAKLASLGGKARRERSRLAERLGLEKVGKLPAKLLADADAFRRTECNRLARLVGGGTCGCAPASMVASAALQLAASRYAFTQGDLALGSRLAVDARQSLLAAHELTAKEAAARKIAEAPQWPWLRPVSSEPEDETAVGDEPAEDETAEDAADGDVEPAQGDDEDGGATSGGPGDE